MATSQQASDRIISSSPGDSHSIESLNMSALDAEKLSDSDNDNLKEQTLSSKDESIVLSNPSRNATTIGPPRDVAGQLGYQGATADHSAVYPSNVYAPHAQTFYYGGYENTGEWVHAADNLELGSPGIYNDNSSLMFHTGYGYNPQMPYGPYSPVTTPLPSVRGDGHIYSSQQFPFSGSPYYQQPVPSNVPYITSPTPVSQTELTIPVNIDQHGDGMPFGQRAVDYSSQFGSFGRGSAYPGHSGNASFYGQGFDGFSSGGHWPDWSKSPDGQRSLTSVSSGAVSPHPYGRNLGMTSQQQRPLFGVGSGSSSYNRGFTHNGVYRSSNFGSASISSLGTNDRWLSIDKARRRGRDNAALCGCNGALDILSEQNRGPRSSKPKTQTNMENVSSVDVDKNDKSTTEAHKEPYNRPNFVTEYTDARFFVIKSYSEDNVHKSIKYGVWASTSNGNRKLDAAYRETKEKQGTCPVFLLFSVNASAQFCGVAEMVGPVDFDKSVDYWQQDKWSGQFPVKWHIIKDVPNSQFRHIILENNDSKPVTNSRDTQEVKLEQGIEMLNIFKNYETDLSILDDFDFYEERQKAMQERKARQQVTSVPAQASEGSEHSDPISMASDLIKQMSKSFAQAVRLDESNKEESTEKVAISASSTVGNGAKTEDAYPLAEQSS